MRKDIIFVFFICLIIMIGISKKQADEPSYGGLNAEILSVNEELIKIRMEEIADLGGEYFLDISNTPVYYVDFITKELYDIGKEELTVGDHITIEVYKSKIKENLIEPETIQLITQRYPEK